MDEEKAQVTGKVQVGSILVDGPSVGDVGNVVLQGPPASGGGRNHDRGPGAGFPLQDSW